MTDTVEAFETSASERSDVVSAVDSIDSTEHLVVADVTRDDAWLAVTVEDAVSTEEWR